MCISTGNFDSIFFSLNSALFELRNLTKMKDTTETVGQHNSTETAQQNCMQCRRMAIMTNFVSTTELYELGRSDLAKHSFCDFCVTVAIVAIVCNLNWCWRNVLKSTLRTSILTLSCFLTQS